MMEVRLVLLPLFSRFWEVCGESWFLQSQYLEIAIEIFGAIVERSSYVFVGERLFVLSTLASGYGF